MAQDRMFSDIQVTSNDIRIEKIGVNDLWRSLKEGLDDFNAKSSFVFSLIVTYPMFARFLTLIVMGEQCHWLYVRLYCASDFGVWVSIAVR